ncbi:MAG: response regulator transcription factor [Deltaproteobacteria bacterium]|nr:response regulator transcription factor [Candidatus Zymogenaceae bacterium]
MKVLLIEDDETIASFIVKGIKECGYLVEHATRGDDGLDLALNESYDIAIIDIMLPRRDGLSIIREMRKKNILTPVIILSARGTVENRVQGLRIGADDYLTKPFSISELIARIQALLRRASGMAGPTVLTAGDLTMNLETRVVTRDGMPVELKPKEFALLEFLMYNRSRVVSKKMIMDHVWDYAVGIGANVIESHISRLRSKIDRDEEKKLIHTVPGVGYVFEERNLE